MNSHLGNVKDGLEKNVSRLQKIPLHNARHSTIDYSGIIQSAVPHL